MQCIRKKQRLWNTLYIFTERLTHQANPSVNFFSSKKYFYVDTETFRENCKNGCADLRINRDEANAYLGNKMGNLSIALGETKKISCKCGPS